MNADHERPPPPLRQCGYILSAAVGCFAVIGWLLTGGLLPWRGFDALTAESAVPVLYAILALIVQATNAVAAAAARRAQSFDLEGSKQWARAVVGAGGLWNAYSLHNAFSHTMPADADWFAIAISWLVSAAVAFIEIAVYFIDEALRSETARRVAAAQDAALSEARAGASSINVRRLGDVMAIPDTQLARAISEVTGLKRKLEHERSRRTKKKLTQK